jgi:hypothetical protein
MKKLSTAALDAFCPIRFSQPHVEAVLARVKAIAPEEIKPVTATKRDDHWLAIWSDAVVQELHGIGIGPEPILVKKLVHSIYRNPAYGRMASKGKSA